MAAEFVTTIKTNEIPVGGVTAIDVRGTRIAVANVGGTTSRLTRRARTNSTRLLKKGVGWHDSRENSRDKDEDNQFRVIQCPSYT